MKKTDAQINIQVNVDCPHCERFIDLLDAEIYSKLNEDGHLYVRLFGDKFGCDDFNEIIACPECKKDFKIESVLW